MPNFTFSVNQKKSRELPQCPNCRRVFSSVSSVNKHIKTKICHIAPYVISPLKSQQESFNPNANAQLSTVAPLPQSIILLPPQSAPPNEYHGSTTHAVQHPLLTNFGNVPWVKNNSFPDQSNISQAQFALENGESSTGGDGPVEDKKTSEDGDSGDNSSEYSNYARYVPESVQYVKREIVENVVHTLRKTYTSGKNARFATKKAA